jgi:hypothetical protein
VVASGVVATHERYPTDRDWAAAVAGARLCRSRRHRRRRRPGGRAGPQAVAARCHGERRGGHGIPHRRGGAQAHGLPFAACRVIIDPPIALPPAALVNLRPDGTPDVAAVLRSVIRQPGQLPALLRVAADARAAQLALRAGRSGSAPA